MDDSGGQFFTNKIPSSIFVGLVSRGQFERLSTYPCTPGPTSSHAHPPFLERITACLHARDTGWVCCNGRKRETDQFRRRFSTPGPRTDSHRGSTKALATHSAPGRAESHTRASSRFSAEVESSPYTTGPCGERKSPRSTPFHHGHYGAHA